jgi:hypothetical protein
MGFTAHAQTDSLDEAIAVARRVLADHITALVDAKLPVPDARAAEAVLADPEVAEEIDEAMATILLPALHPAGRTVRINISIDENTLAMADSAAQDRKLTRSAFIAEACRRFAADDRGGGQAIVGAYRSEDAKELIFRVPANMVADIREAWGGEHEALATVSSKRGDGVSGPNAGGTSPPMVASDLANDERLEIYRDEQGTFRERLVGPNGEVIADGVRGSLSGRRLKRA